MTIHTFGEYNEPNIKIYKHLCHLIVSKYKEMLK